MFSPATDERELRELSELARRVASRLVPWDRAEDISQEVFLLLLASDPPRDVRTFVSAVARRLALGYLRSERRRQERERTYVEATGPRLFTSEPESDDSLRLRRLPSRERLLAGMLFEGLTVREMGERLEEPKSTVQREIEKLRAQFGRTPSPGSGSRRRNCLTSRPTISKNRSA
ncbi:MAG TPA: sigma-70 family RNA polymerase sigma factor [Thermoanaerobaculia bacterium]|nr:sigma-70 family RNA polymerase sigma factor [Thermoanaerobaculia bacterium]HQR66343.1 sigma-70 family RNA polymerase sigma factor [Thermoanaerobaculia bacterium]